MSSNMALFGIYPWFGLWIFWPEYHKINAMFFLKLIHMSILCGVILRLFLFFIKHFYLWFMYTFVSVCTHNFLAFWMSCNPLLSSLFWTLSFFPRFGQWDSPPASLLCLWTCLCHSLSTFLLAHITWCFRFFLHFPWSNHRMRYFSTSNGAFLWKWYFQMVFHT